MASGGAAKARVMVVFHSVWGHMETLAREFAAGAEAAGVEVLLRRVPETLPAEVLAKMHAKPAPEDIPVVDVKTFATEADGFVFGSGTRYGTASAQIKSFLDSTGALWQAGAFRGVPATTIFGTATLGGGQETTALSLVTFLVHHAFVFVPFGYGDPSLFGVTEPHGGGPWGAGYLSAGDGSRAVSESEKNVARAHGKYFAEQVVINKAGKAAIAAAKA